MTNSNKIRSFGRRSGRILRPLMQDTLLSELPKLCFNYGERSDLAFWQKKFTNNFVSQLDTAPKISSLPSNISLEIGFGYGDMLVRLAQEKPEQHYIGAETYSNGIANLCRLIKEKQLNNIQIWPDDAVILLEKLPDHSLDEILVLFPDPWPKTKQWKRRIIRQENLELFARKLKQEGSLIIATDHPGYAEWIAKQFVQSISWQENQNLDYWQQKLDTRYKRKALASDQVYLFSYICLT